MAKEDTIKGLAKDYYNFKSDLLFELANIIGCDEHLLAVKLDQLDETFNEILAEVNNGH